MNPTHQHPPAETFLMDSSTAALLREAQQALSQVADHPGWAALCKRIEAAVEGGTPDRRALSPELIGKLAAHHTGESLPSGAWGDVYTFEPQELARFVEDIIAIEASAPVKRRASLALIEERDRETQWAQDLAQRVAEKLALKGRADFRSESARQDLLAALSSPAAQHLAAAGRSDLEIVEQTEELARFLLSWRWEQVPEDPQANMRDSINARAQASWHAACKIQELITATDVRNAIDNLDEALEDGADEGGACPERA